MSIRDQLRDLVELQVAELDLRRLDTELAALPAERERLRKRIRGAEEAVKAAESEQQESQTARRQLEGELQTAEAKVDKYREQEMLVRRNEELWAIQGEIAGVQKKISGLEEQILEEMEAADTWKERIRDRKQELEAVRAAVDRDLQSVDAREQELRSEREQVIARIDARRQAVDEEILTLYERIRDARAGLGVAEMVDSGCSACQVRQRPQLVVEVNKMAGVRQCGNCKRILFSRDALELPSDVRVAADH